jgi:hypothetical protein
VRRRSTCASSAAVDIGPGLADRHGQHLAHLLLAREAQAGEVPPDRLVLGARQQHDLGPLDAAAGAPDLLVVGDGGLRRPEVDDEPEVGLVEAHAERARGDQRRDPVGEQVVLGGPALGVVGAARVRGRADPPGAQEGGELVGGGDRQAVDDAAARQLAQVVGQPGPAVRRAGQRQHRQVQRGAVQRPAQDERLVTARGELLGDVGDHPAVGRWRSWRARGCRAAAREQRPDAAVVGAEVVAPVGDAVRLVDDEQPAVAASRGSTASRKPGLLSRSGLTSRTSTAPRATSS